MKNSEKIEETLEHALRSKLANYKPETSHMPFHTRLLGRDRMALFSFIHSLNTGFGTQIFEKIAEDIVKTSQSFDEIDTQHKINNILSSESQIAITNIMNDLTSTERPPSHEKELKEIRKVCQSGEPNKKRLRKADIFLTNNGNEFFLIDLKTAKPNMDGFEKYKQNMLEQAAAILYETPKATVHTMIAIPYNPYHPKPYKRWTLQGMLDMDRQLKVAEEFWNFLAGGEDIYQDLLDCFERVGNRMREEIDDYFDQLADN